MKDATGRLFLILSLIASIAGCAPDRALGPDDDPSFASVGGSSFGLTSTAVSYTQIDLAWIDASNSESGYELWRSTTGPTGTFDIFATTGFDVTSFSDFNVTAMTEYCYRVRLFRRTGRKNNYSAFSNTSCATTPVRPPPAAPSSLNARPLEYWSNAALVTWSDNSTDEEGFRVERAPSDQGPWEEVAVRAANTTGQNDHNRPLEQQLCYRVIAVRGSGESASNVDCTYLPAAPTALTVTAVSGHAVELAWTDNSAYEESFVVYRALEYGAYASVGTVGADVTTFRDVTVSADQTYHYLVRVTREGVGTGSTNSVKAVTVTGPPLAPSALSVTPSGSTGVSVFWTDNSATEMGFRVERSENGGGTWVEAGSVESPPFAEDGLTSDREVCYRAFAFNSLGDSPPSNMDCSAPPAAPTSLVATTAPGLSIDLTWTDNSSVEDGYVVQRWYDGGCGYSYCYQYYEVIATLGPNATSYRDTGPTPGQLQLYVVNAVKEGAYSHPSNEAAAYPDTPPEVASNLTAVAVTSARIDLAWNDNSSDETHFHVARCNGTEATCRDENFLGLGGVGPNVTTFSDTGVQPGTTYTYRVHSCSYRCAAASNKASATTPP